MKELNNIANRFSDAYIVALLEGSNVQDVIASFETAFPELGESFRRDAKDLELLYGHIRKSQLPTETEIAAAYSKFRTNVPALPKPVPEGLLSRFSKSIASFFQTSPATAGASAGIALAVLLAIIWQPWTKQEPPTSAANDKQITAPPLKTEKTPGQIAEAPKTSNNFSEPQGPTFRGREQGTQDKSQLDKKDRTHLSRMPVDVALTAPTGLKIIGASDSVVLIRWNPVKNALSYIVEVKRANEGEFKAVSQTSQTQARISGLPSSERMEIRVIAASGDRKGEASAAKNITVP